jgi:putative intracellular protease/amidase
VTHLTLNSVTTTITICHSPVTFAKTVVVTGLKAVLFVTSPSVVELGKATNDPVLLRLVISRTKPSLRNLIIMGPGQKKKKREFRVKK